MGMAEKRKTCFKCGDTKDLSSFYRHKQMADGHLNKCKDCAKKDVRNHRYNNIDRIREYDRERSSLPHRKAMRARVGMEYLAEFPDRRRAHSDVSNAIRDGRLTKRPCVFCGTENPVEAHHHDYSKPLDVTWLCKPCHRRFHALERMATYNVDRDT